MGDSRVTIPDPLKASPGPGAAQNSVKAVGTVWDRDLNWYKKINNLHFKYLTRFGYSGKSSKEGNFQRILSVSCNQNECRRVSEDQMLL